MPQYTEHATWLENVLKRPYLPLITNIPLDSTILILKRLKMNEMKMSTSVKNRALGNVSCCAFWTKSRVGFYTDMSSIAALNNPQKTKKSYCIILLKILVLFKKKHSYNLLTYAIDVTLIILSVINKMSKIIIKCRFQEKSWLNLSQQHTNPWKHEFSFYN